MSYGLTQQQILNWLETVEQRLKTLESTKPEETNVQKVSHEWLDPELKEIKDRLALLEKPSSKEPTPMLYAPLRGDTGPLMEFIALGKRLLDPDDLACQIPLEVRNAVRKIFGIPRSES